MSDRYSSYDDRDSWSDSDYGYGSRSNYGYDSRSSRDRQRGYGDMSHRGSSNERRSTSYRSGSSQDRILVSSDMDEGTSRRSSYGTRRSSSSRSDAASSRYASDERRARRDSASSSASRDYSNTYRETRSSRSSYEGSQERASRSASSEPRRSTSSQRSSRTSSGERVRSTRVDRERASRSSRDGTERTRTRSRSASEVTAASSTRTRRSATPRKARNDAYAGGGESQRTWFSGKLRIALIAVAVLVVVGAGAAFAYVNTISGNLHQGVTQDLKNALVKTDMANEPFYMLLMGTDGSAERDTYEDMGGAYRSDSIMLARIDAPNKKVTLISIHRDTRVDLGEYGENKLNAAYLFGGPALMVETVSKLAGVPISHYAEINFDAFRGLVDALGGIEVDVPVDIDDEDAEGTLSAGLQTLNGDQALVLCRSRNTYNETAGDPDMMRAANQRLVLSAIAHKLLDSDVATIASSVRSVSEYVTTTLDLNDIVGLAQAFQGLDTEKDLYSAMQPVDALYENEIWWAITAEPEWSDMMKRVNEGLPPTEYDEVDEVTGTILATAGGVKDNSAKNAWVAVKNGTKRAGLATEAASLLNAAGFVNTVVGEANNTNFRETLIIYEDPVQAYEAGQIAAALGQGKLQLNNDEYLYDGQFLVLIGSDWQEGLAPSASQSSGA